MCGFYIVSRPVVWLVPLRAPPWFHFASWRIGLRPSRDAKPNLVVLGLCNMHGGARSYRTPIYGYSYTSWKLGYSSVSLRCQHLSLYHYSRSYKLSLCAPTHTNHEPRIYRIPRHARQRDVDVFCALGRESRRRGEQDLPGIGLTALWCCSCGGGAPAHGSSRRPIATACTR